MGGGWGVCVYHCQVDFDNLVAQSAGQRRRQEEKEMRARLLVEQQLEIVQKEINGNLSDWLSLFVISTMLVVEEAIKSRGG